MTLLAGKSSIEEGCREVLGKLDTDDPCSKAKDIHVVMLYSLVSRVDVVAKARSDPGTLLAAMHAPTPLPQITIPRPASPDATARATASA